MSDASVGLAVVRGTDKVAGGEKASVGLGRSGLGAASPCLYEQCREFSDYFCEWPTKKCPR